ncbi:MAG: KEOPS complex subunit Pcc1 [Fervidicoccaceae archaeon]
MKVNKYVLNLTIHSSNSKLIHSLFLSLKPEEASQADEKRGKVIISQSGENALELTIESTTDSGFRALINSYLYLLKVSLDSTAISE